MANVNNAGDRATRWIRWIARIWGTLILGITLIVLIGYAVNWVKTGKADPYAAEDYPPIENLPPLFVVLSATGLGIAWRWEGWGGAIAAVFQLAMLPVLLIQWPIAQDSRFVVPYIVSMMVATPGVLFLVCWWRSRRRAIPHNGD